MYRSFHRIDRYEWGCERPATEPGVMQLVYKDEQPYGAAFACPCGCEYGDWITFHHPDEMKHSQNWDFKLVDGMPIIRPSLQRHTP